MKHTCLLFFLLLAGLGASGQVVLRSYSTSNGFGTTSGATQSLTVAIGQSLSGTGQSASYTHQSGYLAVSAIEQIADLAFNGTLTLNPTSVDRGNTVDAFFRVKNNGTKAIDGAITLRAYLSTNQLYDGADKELPPATTLGNSLGVGAEINKSDGIKLMIPSDQQPGSYYIVLVVDPGDQIKERLETNNSIYANLGVTSGDDSTPPVILPPSGGTFAAGASISVTITDNKAVKFARFVHRPITKVAFDTISLTVNAATYATTMEEKWGDELGMEGYFIAADNAGNPARTNSLYWYRAAPAETAIPFVSEFGGSKLTYELFSIPYKLEKDGITSIFDELADGKYDETKWRLFHYDGASNRENATTVIEPGLGYWINMKEKTPVKIGSGSVVNANQAEGFKIELRKGWNQIGNPYPFAIDWNTVRDQFPGLDALNFYDHGYTTVEKLEPWTGAFVLASDAMPIRIPVTARVNGRTARDEMKPDIDALSWLLPIRFDVGSLSNVAGVGMHPEANLSKDKFDGATPPRFWNYADLSIYHEDFFARELSTDIVPRLEEFTWNFTVNTNLPKTSGRLSWDYTAIASSRAGLVIIDTEKGSWVDMKTTGTLDFEVSDGRTLKVLYDISGEIHPDISLVGEAWPNPFTDHVTFPILQARAAEDNVIEICDFLGRTVRAIQIEHASSAIADLHWDGRDQNGDQVAKGLYFYRLRGAGQQHVRRLIRY